MQLAKRGLAIALLAALGLSGCASGGSKTESTTAPGADFAGYQTFALQPAGAGAASAEVPVSILDATVHDAIRAELLGKGYREVGTNGDLQIQYETAESLREVVKESPFRVGVGMGSWGGNVGGGVGASAPVGSPSVATSPETRITIRAVDRAANREVWVGTATGGFGQSAGAGAVEKAVAGAMKDFPKRRE
jgi:hypothetical protein